MKTFVNLGIAILSFVTMISGQSGTGKKKPPPIPNTSSYSESTPFDSRKSSQKSVKKSQSGISKFNQSDINFNNNDVIKINSTLVTIPISISNSYSGLYVSDLVKGDFKIYEDGIEQEIAYFGMSDKPLTVILLLDTSPSTKYKIEEIQEAASVFVNQLKPQDRVEVIKFNRKIRVLVRATKNRQKIHKAINKAKFSGGTSLYDSVDFALKERLKKVRGRTAIVLFTDGVDTTSDEAFYDDTVQRVEQSNTVIFAIFYDTYSKVLKKGKRSSVRELGERKLGKMYLNELATLSGGRLVEPELTSHGLNEAFKAIAEELRHQYTIGYYPLIEGKPGQRKQLKVRVYRSNLRVRARDNYVVSLR